MPISLSEWETFYVITGSSAAALTGLMFVVVALAADRRRVQVPDGVGAFSTPTVGHFVLVLLLACIMTMPGHTVLSLGICIGGSAAFGLLAAGLGGLRMKRLTAYKPETEDWVWHVILPFISYAILLVSVFLPGTQRESGLVVVAAVVLALIFIGIHNAWDVAVYLVTEGASPADAPKAAPTTPPKAQP